MLGSGDVGEQTGAFGVREQTSLEEGEFGGVCGPPRAQPQRSEKSVSFSYRMSCVIRVTGLPSVPGTEGLPGCEHTFRAKAAVLGTRGQPSWFTP